MDAGDSLPQAAKPPPKAAPGTAGSEPVPPPFLPHMPQLTNSEDTGTATSIVKGDKMVTLWMEGLEVGGHTGCQARGCGCGVHAGGALVVSRGRASPHVCTQQSVAQTQPVLHDLPRWCRLCSTT